ncbi:TIR-like protein FxsC [Kitasatospora sp. NPDC090091]|uniref:TIR-like protein FxsC n=1 Tax=Kitasatospora sp. NPDC090091 TaxID=3364081 RepID=UPI0038213ED1
MTDRLLRALAEADAASAAGLGPEELADILWLAGCLDDAARGRDRPAVPADPGGSAGEAAPGAGPDGGPADEHAPDEPPFEQHYATADLAAPPAEPDHAPEPGPEHLPGAPGSDRAAENAPAARRGDLVRVPRAAALADPLAVMRALRPLGRRTLADSHGEPELDEEATVSAGVDQGLLLPVLRPTPGRWLDLALVIDTHRSMTLWHDLVAELRRVIAQTGVFRDVRTWYLGGTEAGGRPGLAARPGGALRRPQEIADPAGRRLILVVTDTVGGGWGGPALDAVLRGWGRHGPVAVLNVLPERLWSRGSVRPAPLWLRAAGPVAPNTAWEAAATRARGRTHRRLRADAPDRPLPVPVVDPSPASLAALAALVSGGGRRSRLSCLLVGEPGAAPAGRADRTPPADEADRPPAADGGRPPTAAEPALERFRASASPLAQELAGHLSAVPLVLPVMTLVRRAMLPQADHGHLAEVLLGGLLAPWEAPPPGTDPDVVEFDFLPGVRDALLGAQRRDTVARIRRTVRHQVAAYLRSRRASAADFPAVRVAEETRSRALAPDALPFAESPAAVPARTPALAAAYLQPEESWASMTVAEALERPELLGVRPAEQRPGLPYLTPYLDRPVDAEIRRLVGRAAQGISTVLLIAGAPASGRTRACFEALRALPADWTVWRAQSLPGRELRPEEPERCTVVWFDEAERVLNTPQGQESDLVGRISAWARSRSRGPLLLLGTVRTDRHDPPGPAGSPAGGMLRHVRMLEMPEYFDRQQAADAVLGSDPRLAEAARVAADGGVVQALTAAPGLRARFDRAPEEVRAVLDAALDALRLGHHRSLPASLLRAAAPGYLHTAPATDTWFERAMADATAEGAGGAGLIRADHGSGFEGSAAPRAPYTLHPLLEAWYLDGRTGSVPPDAFWDALLAHADRGDLSRLARGARSIGADARAEELAAAASTYYRHRYAQFVDSGGGAELAGARPYFFLSYAHTPRAGATGAGDPNLWVRQLYRDLCEAVLQLTDVPAGVPVGFMDESMHQGELWADRIARELATCRVFVPLYSPRYFDSLPCGQEWYTFTRRKVYAADRESERTSAIVPVLWAPMNRYRLPEVAGELQFDHSGFGPDYVSEGLFALMKLSYYRSAYELAVHRLARRIVEVAEETVVPVGRTLDLSAQPSAFEPVRRSVRELRVLVLSCRRDELPAGPSPTAYGPQRTDWNPYGSTLGRSLAEHTAGLLRGMGFEPTVYDLVSEGERLLGEESPTALAVLLLDRWALLDAERIALLRRLDRRNHKVVAVLEPGSPDDPGDTAAGAELAELSRSALAAGGFLPAGRPRANRLPVLGSLSAFEDALAGVATAARRAVENRWPDGPRRGSDGEEGGSPGRPRLR